MGNFYLGLWRGAPFSLESFLNPSLLAALKSSLCLLCFLVRLLPCAWSLYLSTWFEKKKKKVLKEKASISIGSLCFLFSQDL